jgi:hypothetical protein
MPQTDIFLSPVYLAYNAGEERPYCVNYMNSAGELASTRLTYDSRGRNTMGFFQQISGSRSSRNAHHFDPQGRMIRKERTYNDGLTSTERFLFDDRGRLAEETFEDSTGTTGKAYYEYDASGRAVRMKATRYKGWFSGEVEFCFDRWGRRESAILRLPDGASGTIAYTYEGDRLLREHWEVPGWNQTLQYVYEAT